MADGQSVGPAHPGQAGVPDATRRSRYAKEIARKESGEMYIHRDDGTIRERTLSARLIHCHPRGETLTAFLELQ